MRQQRRRAYRAIEALESRILLAVTAGEYASIRSTYAGFALPADMAQVNVIEITPDQLSVANLKNAIAAAAGTTLSDLVVVRTTDTQNTITYGSSADTLAIDIPSAQGAISIVGFGTKPLTLNAAGKCGVVKLGSFNSTTSVNFGGLTLTGGLSYAGGGGINQSYGSLVLTNVTISGNTGYFGGGAYLYCGTSTLTNVTISGNTAPFSGGGVYQSSGSSTLTNVTISGNMAQESGGGVYQYFAPSTLTNVTISGNTALQSGGGIYRSMGALTLRNAIVARNAGGSAPDLYQSVGAFIYGANNLIGDGTGQTGLVNGTNSNRVGTTASPVDPGFASMTGTDWTLWNLRLQASSPAVDAGDNAWIPAGVTTDIAGGPRIVGAAVDMGAYEFAALPSWMGAGSAATWDAAGKMLMVSGSATITGDPGADSPNITIGSGGVLTVSSNGALVVSSLSLTGTGKLDLRGCTMLVKYTGGVSPIGNVIGWLKSARNGGAWDGSGIGSSAAAGNGSYGLGVVDDAGSRQVKVMCTLLGDTNLDGKVDVGDLGTLLNNYGQAGKNWSDGECSYNAGGTVDVGDLGVLLNNYGQTTASLAGMSGTAVASVEAVTAGDGTTGLVEPAVSISQPVTPPSGSDLTDTAISNREATDVVTKGGAAGDTLCADAGSEAISGGDVIHVGGADARLVPDGRATWPWSATPAAGGVDVAAEDDVLKSSAEVAELLA